MEDECWEYVKRIWERNQRGSRRREQVGKNAGRQWRRGTRSSTHNGWFGRRERYDSRNDRNTGMGDTDHDATERASHITGGAGGSGKGRIVCLE